MLRVSVFLSVSDRVGKRSNEHLWIYRKANSTCRVRCQNGPLANLQATQQLLNGELRGKIRALTLIGT